MDNKTLEETPEYKAKEEAGNFVNVYSFRFGININNWNNLYVL